MNPDDPLTDDRTDLAAAFNRVADRLEAVSRYGQRSRKLIMGTLALVALVAGLYAGLVVFTAQNNSQNELIRDNQAAVKADAAARQRQGRAEMAKICASFAHLAALKPPAAHAGQDSRVFLDSQHAIFVKIGADLGCPAPRQ